MTSAADRATEAVFIVGVSRSGTTLMRRILESSPLIAICPENHYLGHLAGGASLHRRVRRMGDLSDDEVVDRVVRRLYGGGLDRGSWWREPSRAWSWLRRKVPRDEFRRRLLDSDRSERAVFESLLRAYAEQRGKPIMGEKTPSHVRHGQTLLSWFPRGRVVHMLRDPRAIYVSDLRRRRMEPGSLPYRLLRRVPVLLSLVLLVQTTAAWAESVDHLARNRRRFGGRYIVVRFEDLVAAPSAEVERLCAALGISFEQAMLDQVVVSRGHDQGAAGFDAAAAERWRERMGWLARRWFGLWLAGRLRAMGYPAS